MIRGEVSKMTIFFTNPFRSPIRGGILPSAVAHVLRHGYHNPRKDQWDDRHKTWNYAIQGKTLTDQRLRIPVAIEVMPNGHIIVVVTVINLEIEE